jgi:hypothetical protein
MKTIAKFSVFVICVAAAAGLSISCSKAISIEPGRLDSSESQLYQKPVVVGTISSNDVAESSGIAASKCQPGVYWTHNDSGDDPNIYAFSEKGENLGTFRVTNSQNDDWEDIAEYKDQSGKCFIYIADIGDNKRRRADRTIFRVAEPQVDDRTRGTESKNAIGTEPAAVLNFRYPNSERNAETMMVNPRTGDIYVLTKSIEHGSEVFKLSVNFGNSDVAIAQRIGAVVVPNVPNGQLTGGDISPDGKRVVLCDYSWGYELELPEAAKSFDEIWKVKPYRIDIGKLPQTEAIGYTADGLAIIATSENKHPPIVKVRRHQ